VDGFKCIPILLNLERLINGGTTNNLTNVILNFLLVYGDLTLGKIKLICFASNGVVVFITVYSGVITQIFTRKFL